MVLKIKKALLIVTFGFLCISGIFAQSGKTEKRVALVIGNGNYKNSPLKNPVRDAKAMESKLKELGFDVIYSTDADTKTMVDKLDEFYKTAKNSSLALIYYSGHGIESDGSNYLIPVTSEITDEKYLKQYAINLDDVIVDAGESGCKQLIVLIDACRNNPIKKTRGNSRGISVVSLGETAETVTFYACGSGKTADDGDGEHSPFTQALINYIGQQGYSFTDVIRAVKKEVSEKTDGKQNPNSSGLFTEEVYLNGKKQNVINTVYVDDKTDYSKVIRICVLLFLVLILIIFVLFIVFTVEGKRALGIVKEKSDGIKDKISVTYNQIIEKISELKKEKVESELKDIVSQILPSVIVNEDLYVAVSPVTNGQYQTVTGKTFAEGKSDYPVTNISWLQAAEFFNELSQKENLEPVYDLSDKHNIKIDLSKNGWRMPSVSEWLKFAKVPKGGIESESWNINNSNDQIQPCKSKKKNDFGIYDVFGLVWEWCNDVEKEKYHIAKGGAWDASVKQCSRSSKLAVTADFSDDNIGIRGVRNR